jgi:hypothetical protein
VDELLTSESDEPVDDEDSTGPVESNEPEEDDAPVEELIARVVHAIDTRDVVFCGTFQSTVTFAFTVI